MVSMKMVIFMIVSITMIMVESQTRTNFGRENAPPAAGTGFRERAKAGLRTANRFADATNKDAPTAPKMEEQEADAQPTLGGFKGTEQENKLAKTLSLDTPEQNFGGLTKGLTQDELTQYRQAVAAQNAQREQLTQADRPDFQGPGRFRNEREQLTQEREQLTQAGLNARRTPPADDSQAEAAQNAHSQALAAEYAKKQLTLEEQQLLIQYRQAAATQIARQQKYELPSRRTPPADGPRRFRPRRFQRVTMKRAYKIPSATEKDTALLEYDIADFCLRFSAHLVCSLDWLVPPAQRRLSSESGVMFKVIYDMTGVPDEEIYILASKVETAMFAEALKAYLQEKTGLKVDVVDTAAETVSIVHESEDKESSSSSEDKEFEFLSWDFKNIKFNDGRSLIGFMLFFFIVVSTALRNGSLGDWSHLC